MIAKRFIQCSRNFRKQDVETAAIEDKFVVTAADVPGDAASCLALIHMGVVEAHRERGDIRIGSAGDGSNGGAVDTARQKYPDRHVSDKPRTDGMFEAINQLIIFYRPRRAKAWDIVTVAAHGEPVELDRQALARQHTLDVAQDRAPAGSEMQREIAIEREQIDAVGHPRHRADRQQRGAE